MLLQLLLPVNYCEDMVAGEKKGSTDLEDERETLAVEVADGTEFP